MPYTTESMTKSKRAYDILKIISNKEKGSYSTQIAKELEVNQSLVSDIIQKLNEIGILEKGKRTQAQYYNVDTKSFQNIYSKLWSKELGIEKASSIQDFIEILISELEEEKAKDFENTDASDYDKIISELRSNQSAHINDLEAFIEIYSSKYLERIDEATIGKMLYGDFKTSLYKESSDIPNFSILKILAQSMNLISDDSSALYQTFSESKREIIRTEKRSN